MTSSPRSLTADRLGKGCVAWEGHQLLEARTGIRCLESSQRFLDVDLSTLDGFQDREAYGVVLHHRLNPFGSGIGRRKVELAVWPAHRERSRLWWRRWRSRRDQWRRRCWGRGWHVVCRRSRGGGRREAARRRGKSGGKVPADGCDVDARSAIACTGLPEPAVGLAKRRGHVGVAGDRLEGEGRRRILPTGSCSPERQADVTTRGLGAEGAVAGQQRVEEDIAVGGLDMETLDLGRGDVNVAAGGLRGRGRPVPPSMTRSPLAV